MTVAELTRLAKRLEERLRGDPNVVGVGIGVKERGGRFVAGPALRVVVRRKFATEDEIRAAGSSLVPEQFEGVLTDVDDTMLAANFWMLPVGDRGTSIQEPLVGGVSTSVLGSFVPSPTGYGTLGAICTRESDGRLMALSNAHVWGSAIGSDIVQPVVPVPEFFEGSVKLATCGPVISYLAEGEPPSGLTAVLATAAEVAWIAAIAADVVDPHRRGEEATVPVQAGERTVAESVRLAAEPDRLPLPGTAFRADVGFSFERRTDRGRYTFDARDERVNEHLLVQRRLWTDVREYTAGRVVELYALLEAPQAVSAETFHVVAHLSPMGDPGRRVSRVLRPADCDWLPFRCAGFPDADPDSEVEFPFEYDGLTYQGAQPGFFRDRWPPDQAIELQFPDGMTIEIPPTEQAYVRVVQFSTDPVTLEGFETDGTLAATARTDGRTRVEHVLSVRGRALTRLVLHGGANEALLLEVCLHRQKRGGPDAAYRDAVPGSTRRGTGMLCYRGRFTLGAAEPPGRWRGLLSAQTVNTTPPGTPADEAATTIGGIECATIAPLDPGACLITLALDDLFDVI